MSNQNDFKQVSGHFRLGSDYVPSISSTLLDVTNPATEETIGQIAECTSDEINAVIDLANKAQKPWAKLDAVERVHYLHSAAQRMRDRKHELARLMTIEMGKTYKEAVDETSWCAHTLDYLAEMARHDIGRVMEPAAVGQLHYTLKQPVGVAALIMPFNYPYVLMCWEAGAALATGCSVIVKPSELSSLCTLEFLRCFDVLPDGMVQCVTGTAHAGKMLVESTDTHAVCFTGSVGVGQMVAETCSRQFKPALIEASGNDPFIVMPSAKLDVAAQAAAFAAFMNCGQICTAAERFYIHKDIHDEFVELLVAATKKIRVGSGLDKVDMGPMTASRERDRYEKILQRAQEQGAKIAIGGDRPDHLSKGWFVNPTVLVDVTPDMDIMNNECFGPAAPICKVDSYEQAIELANRSKFGLGANIYTRDLEQGIRATEQLEAGMVWVNAPLLDNDAAPFGGVKMSGIGRQLGSEGFELFRNTKMVMIDPASSVQDFWWIPYKDEEMYQGEK